MDLLGLKQKHIRDTLGIGIDFGKVHAFIDFGNVNYWFAADRQASDGTSLKDDERLEVDIAALHTFVDCFAEDARFYYGHDAGNPGSLGFIRVARDAFGKHRVHTKQIQKIRHYLGENEAALNTRETYSDVSGTFILIPKCNFDVEIAVDAIRQAGNYDTFCLLSSDADFVHLARYLKSKGKKVLLIKGGYIVHQLKTIADLVISAQDIKKFITVIKQKPGQ
jgi:hypothetical protein